MNSRAEINGIAALALMGMMGPSGPRRLRLVEDLPTLQRNPEIETAAEAKRQRRLKRNRENQVKK